MNGKTRPLRARSSPNESKRKRPLSALVTEDELCRMLLHVSALLRVPDRIAHRFETADPAKPAVDRGLVFGRVVRLQGTLGHPVGVGGELAFSGVAPDGKRVRTERTRYAGRFWMLDLDLADRVAIANRHRDGRLTDTEPPGKGAA